MQLNFDISKYPGRYAMHCPSLEKAEMFCEYLNSIGRSWINGNSYERTSEYEHYKEDTCYVFNSGQFGSVVQCIECGFKMLNIDDFLMETITEKPFTITKEDFYNLIF